MKNISSILSAMKKPFPIVMLLSILFFLGSCGSDEDSETSTAEYFIAFGDDLVECDDLRDISYVSDGVADVTTFKIESAVLELNGFHADFKLDPKSVEGKTYNAKITFDDVIEGKVTIDKVHDGVERSIAFDHKMEGKFESNDGETGKFSVSVLFVP